MDAAAKLGIVAAFTVAIFLVPVGARGFGGLITMASAVAIAVLVARVPLRAALRGLRAVGLLMLFTIVVNSFAAPSASSLLVIGPLAVDGPGLTRGAFFAARIMLLVTGTSLLTLTTSPLRLAGGIERALAPLKVVRVPVGDLAMTLTIALRFIPTTAQEAEDIVTAQQARGASFDRGGPLARARAYVPVLVPLFFQLFRRADALATAMEARCYRGGEGRTRLNEEHMAAVDWIAMLGVSVVLVAAGWFL